VFTTFKVNGRDLTTYIRGQRDEGLDLSDPDASTPQFAGSLGLGDGQAWIRDSATNKEMQIPLLLDAASTDALHKLVRDVKADLFNGAQVEVKVDQATDSTFFTLETGQLLPEYEFFLHQNNRLRAMLKLWSRPHGHTATQRMLASTRTSGVRAAVGVLAATGVIGDRDAFMGLRVRVGSQVASSGRLIAYGVSRYNTPGKEYAAGDFAGHAPAASSVTVGASGAYASQYLAIPVGPTVASGIAHRHYLAPAPVGGRSRVFAILRSGLYPPDAMRLYAKDRFGALLGPTALATQVDQSKWMVADLGEINFPAQPSGLEGVPSQEIQLYAGGAAGASVVASPALHLTGLVLLPLEVSAGVMLSPGYAAGLLYQDSFDRFGAEGRFLHDSANAEPGPGVWSQQGGYMGKQTGLALTPYTVYPVSASLSVAAGATAFVAIGSGAVHRDIQVDVQTGVKTTPAQQPTAFASGALARVFPKQQSASQAATVGICAELSIGPSANHYLALFSHDGSATTLHASRGLGGSSATAFYQGRLMNLTARVTANLCDVFLGTGPLAATPIISATHANFAQIAGHPALFGRTGGGHAAPVFENFSARAIGGSAPDAAAREWFKFDSYPQGRAIRGATTYQEDVVGYLRGNFPRMPAIGSPAPSGAAYIVVLSGTVDDFIGNDSIDVEAYVTSRFDFLR
jgi:hypothetical protein